MNIFRGQKKNTGWLGGAKKKAAHGALDSIFGKGEGKKRLKTKYGSGSGAFYL